MPKIHAFEKFFEQSGLSYSIIVCDDLIKSKYGSDQLDSVLRISGTDFCFDDHDDLMFSRQNGIQNADDIKELEKFKLASNITIDKKIGLSRPIVSSECKYLEDDELPALVLYTNRWYPFKDMSRWRAIRHQCAGLACDQFELVGMILSPNDRTRVAIRSIQDRWLDSNCGAFHSSLDDMGEYRDHLVETLGVDCNYSFDDFREAVYPIDINMESIQRLVTDDLPNDLDDLIEWENDFTKVFGLLNRWNLCILGQNSD